MVPAKAVVICLCTKTTTALHVPTSIYSAPSAPTHRLISTVHKGEVKGKAKGLDTCYSATYMSQTRDQQRFTISEVAADWHEPMVP